MKKIKVKRVIDGDTFVDENDMHYRLASVYAPESCWRIGEDATWELEKMIGNKAVEVVWQRKELSHGRAVVKIKKMKDDESINDKMRQIIKKNGWDK